MSRDDELVAVVTGGSRGIGKGVARALAERGATVYIAGRSQAGGIRTSPGGALLPGTIQEAAEEVNSLGGRGIAVACDLSVDEEIRSLFERVRQESGHLNILVNNAAYLNEKMFVRPFWEAPVELANIIDVGLRCHHVATYYAAPLLIAQRRGLIVAAISLWPGYVATERMTQLMETDPGVKQLKEKMGFESTELSGRVIRALYDDPNLLTLSGKTIITAEAAERYGISDLDGYEPKSLRGIYGSPHPAFDIQ